MKFSTGGRKDSYSLDRHSYCPSVVLTNSRGKYPRHPESRRMSREAAAVAETTSMTALA
ncbi:hypothetical protein QTP88_008273 [Uroleucon formosanum]